MKDDGKAGTLSDIIMGQVVIGVGLWDGEVPEKLDPVGKPMGINGEGGDLVVDAPFSLDLETLVPGAILKHTGEASLVDIRGTLGIGIIKPFAVKDPPGEARRVSVVFNPGVDVGIVGEIRLFKAEFHHGFKVGEVQVFFPESAG